MVPELAMLCPAYSCDFCNAALCAQRRDVAQSGSTVERPMKRLKILCLHGYHGSAATLRNQMADLVRGMDRLAEWVYVDAPSLAVGDFGWWHATADTRVVAARDAGVGPGSKHYQGWARTREALVGVFKTEGPFDGVFGFSQGAALTSLLVGLRASPGLRTSDKPLRFDFAIMVGGFPVADPELAKLYGGAPCYQLPSLHLVGRSDGIVPIEASKVLASKFAQPLIVEHDGGHVVAATSQVCQRVSGFLGAMTQRASAGV